MSYRDYSRGLYRDYRRQDPSSAILSLAVEYLAVLGPLQLPGKPEACNYGLRGILGYSAFQVGFVWNLLSWDHSEPHPKQSG